MTRARPLPEPLGERPFSVAEARAAAVSPSRLRASDLVVPTRGARAPATPSVPIPDGETPSERMARLREDLCERARRFAPALTPDQFFSHETGLGLVGAPLPYTTAERRALHISARRPAGKPRRSGAVGHRLQRRDPARWRIDQLPIEHPARMWRQAGSLWELDDLIAAGDFLILPKRRLLTLDDLQNEIDEAGDLPHANLARALAEIRVGAETAEETRLRLALVRSGLPEPELNYNLCTPGGSFVARVDLAYPRRRIAIEQDGRTHAFDEKQFARDADRWEEIGALGWHLVRILSHHLHPDPSRAVARVTEALVGAGWRPGAA
jgi:very-short-patch-repair endonuclease